MEVKSVHIFTKHEDEPASITASIEVPGLGVVEIAECLSDATVRRVCAEVKAALKAKLGQIITTEGEG